VAKSIYRQNAADYLSLAETACCEKKRSLLLLASEWLALADAAAMRSKHRAVRSALNSVPQIIRNEPRWDHCRDFIAGC
jgi:hypothetical protein